jgi:hypothetical protein
LLGCLRLDFPKQDQSQQKVRVPGILVLCQVAANISLGRLYFALGKKCPGVYQLTVG